MGGSHYKTYRNNNASDKKLFHSRIYIDMDNKNTMIVVVCGSVYSRLSFSEYKLQQRKKFQQEIEMGDDDYDKAVCRSVEKGNTLIPFNNSGRRDLGFFFFKYIIEC